jgi:hypothetical protein
MKSTKTTPLSTAPTQSISANFWTLERSGLGLREGKMKKYTGERTPASGRLM